METPKICSHLVSDASPRAGIEIDGIAYWTCPACFCIKLSDALANPRFTPSDALEFIHVEKSFALPVTHAMVKASCELKEAGFTTVSNRMNVIRKTIYRRATALPPRRYGFDDGRGPSYKRAVIVPCVVEKKSLSNYAGVEVWNRVEVTA